jgi:penicillin amidase
LSQPLDRAVLQACLPDVTADIALPELTAPVTICRDYWGIPHITAANEQDLFCAQGFATAQDRLWHMDADRHQALGRWSEFAGNTGLGRDRLLRAAGMGRTAKLDLQVCSKEALQMAEAYAAGVNAFMRTTETLPIEYRLLQTEPEPWESWHCLAVYKIRNSLIGSFEPKLFRTRLAAMGKARELAHLMRGYPSGHLLTVPPGEEYAGVQQDGLNELSRAADDVNWLQETDVGSNAWSISGNLTRSGLPLVCGDSHRGLDVPSVYYQVHLSCPDLQVIGSSLPGVPGALHFCHNERVAWGMTYGSADTQDLFIERFREAENGREYEFSGEWRPAQVLREVIRVDGESDQDLEVTITHHGPVIAGAPREGWGIAISDPGLTEGSPWLDAVLDLMKADSVKSLEHAFRNWTDRVNNYAVADVDGNFGYLHEGKIPIREVANGWRAVPGWGGDHEWRGYIPQAELPRTINPACGYAVTCNQRVAGSDYPYYVGLNFAFEFRARRIQTHLLSQPEKGGDIESMRRIHADCVSIPAQVLTAVLLRSEPLDDASAHALEQLGRWDLRLDRELAAPAIYAATQGKMLRRLAHELFDETGPLLLSDEPGADVHLRLLALQMHLAMESDDRALLPSGLSWERMAAEALKEAVVYLTERLGPDMSNWRWGQLHHTDPRHPLSARFPHAAPLLDPPGLAVHGGGDTPLAGSYPMNGGGDTPLSGGGVADGDFIATGMSVNRYIHDPSDWSSSLWIVPLGASGHPGSPHYADQAETWANVEYIPQLWDWERIAATAETIQELRPAG